MGEADATSGMGEADATTVLLMLSVAVSAGLSAVAAAVVLEAEDPVGAGVAETRVAFPAALTISVLRVGS